MTEDNLTHYWDPLNDHDVDAPPLAHCGRRSRKTAHIDDPLHPIVTCEACLLLKLEAFARGEPFVTGMYNYHLYRAGIDKDPEVTDLTKDTAS